MKITIVQGAFFPVPPLMGGAVEKVWFSLGQEFARAGHEVTHISRQYASLPTDETIEGVRHFRVPGHDTPKSSLTLKLYDLLYSLRVLHALPKADILITNTFWLPILVRGISFGRLYVHVARFPKGQMKLYAHAASLQTVSRAVSNAIIEQFPASSALVKVIPYPLPETFTLPPFATHPRENVVLYCGRIHPEKGIYILLKAFSKANRSLSEKWKLRLVGPWQTSLGGGGDAYRHELLSIDGASNSESVEWTGPLFKPEELHRHYRRASLFVYPSLAEKGESFGLAPLEAMAQGCPPIVSDLDCFRDFIEPESNGIIFNHRSPNCADLLEKELLRLMTDPDTRLNLGRAAEATAQRYRPEAIARLFLDDFQSLLPCPKTP